jgi:hydroxymethylpyrimidine pyrophosphatase-like HAD family hydrolase
MTASRELFFMAFATDYDGTLAADGSVDERAIAALERLRASGRKLLLVTGRELPDLRAVFSRLDLFDRVVAENGALLHCPATGENVALGPAPPPAFIARLKERRVAPLSTGHVIVATRVPHDADVLDAIRDLGLELQIIFNKGAVMVLPPGINKATGLAAALAELSLSPLNVVAVGDAENDHAFLAACGCGVAVENALPMLKDAADWVTEGARGDGVVELAERLLRTDLADLALSRRPGLTLGKTGNGAAFRLDWRGEMVLLAGGSGADTLSLAAALLEQIRAAGMQFVALDLEEDDAGRDGVAAAGDAREPPRVAAMLELLREPEKCLAVDLRAVARAERPAFVAELTARLAALRHETGRPHWLVVGAADEILPGDWLPPPGGVIVTASHPRRLPRDVLRQIDAVLLVGDRVGGDLRAFAQAIGMAVPSVAVDAMPSGEGLLWRPSSSAPPVRLRLEQPQANAKRRAQAL